MASAVVHNYKSSYSSGAFYHLWSRRGLISCNFGHRRFSGAQKQKKAKKKVGLHRPGSFNVFTIIQTVPVFLGHDGITLNTLHGTVNISPSPPSPSIRFPPSFHRTYSPPLPRFLQLPPSLAPQGMSECTVEWRREVGLALPNSISEEHELRGARLPPKSRRGSAFTAPGAPRGDGGKKTGVNIQHSAPRSPLLPLSRKAEHIEKSGEAAFPHLYMIYADMMTNGAKIAHKHT